MYAGVCCASRVISLLLSYRPTQTYIEPVQSIVVLECRNITSFLRFGEGAGAFYPQKLPKRKTGIAFLFVLVQCLNMFLRGFLGFVGVFYSFLGVRYCKGDIVCYRGLFQVKLKSPILSMFLFNLYSFLKTSFLILSQ